MRRYGFPRTDLTVTLDGVTIKPSLALGGWIAFKPMHDGAMVMGDLVLLETEINPVMAKLIEGGLEITAVHNHLLRASPATFYMHVGGHGDPVKMAGVFMTRSPQARRRCRIGREPATCRLISTPRNSTRSSAPGDRTMAVSTSSPSHAAIRSAKAAWKSLLSDRWA